MIIIHYHELYDWGEQTTLNNHFFHHNSQAIFEGIVGYQASDP
jgi:hypothetical protein